MYVEILLSMGMRYKGVCSVAVVSVVLRKAKIYIIRVGR